MSAEKIIRTLLTASSTVTALVSDRVYPGEIPQGVALPAIGLTHISTVEVSTIDASAANMLVQSRIECTALAKDYATVKSIISAIRSACNYAHGTVAGFSVVSVRRDLVGYDTRDSDTGILAQTIDFQVYWQEPNT
jgi:hypothetical protein